MDKRVIKAKQYSIKAHNKVNHKYDDKNYSFHLEMVYEFGEMFMHLIPKKDTVDVASALWGHDRIEDCQETYNDIKKYNGKNVADIVYGVTDYRGRTREERKPKALYDGMLADLRIKFVKLADRLANIKYSKSKYDLLPADKKGKGMFVTYSKESTDFKKKLYLSSNMREMFKVIGFRKSFKVFKYHGIGTIISSTFKNRKAEPLQEMWDYMDVLLKVD